MVQVLRVSRLAFWFIIHKKKLTHFDTLAQFAQTPWRIIDKQMYCTRLYRDQMGWLPSDWTIRNSVFLSCALAVKFSIWIVFIFRTCNISLKSHFLAGLVLEIGLFVVEIRKRLICSQVQFIPNCFEENDRFPFDNKATVNTTFYQRNGRLFILEGC